MVKICAHTHKLKTKPCACTSKHAHTHLCLMRTYFCTKLYKNCIDPSFFCGNIHTITLNIQARGIDEYAKYQHTRVHVFASWRSCAQIFINIYLVVHYSDMSLSFKFYKYPIFHCKIERFFFGHHCKVELMLP